MLGEWDYSRKRKFWVAQAASLCSPEPETRSRSAIERD